MNSVAKVHDDKTKILEKVLLGGDLKTLSADEKMNYFYSVCESVGLNPLTKPFDFIPLNGKLTMYATKNATDQLRTVNKVSVKITAREKIGDVYVVTAQATLPDGRCDESTGAVNITGIKGDALANAYMKCETKAKRRVTLSICGLGLLDESEVETIPGAGRDAATQVASAPIQNLNQAMESPGDFVMDFSKGYRGKKLKDMPRTAVEQILEWAIDNNAVPHFQEAAMAYLDSLPEEESNPLDQALAERDGHMNSIMQEEVLPFEKFE